MKQILLLGSGELGKEFMVAVYVSGVSIISKLSRPADRT